METTFIRHEFKVGDKVEVVVNLCNEDCECYYNPSHKQWDLVDMGKVYTIKEIQHIGAGCPSRFLALEEMPQTHTELLPGNWFGIVK